MKKTQANYFSFVHILLQMNRFLQFAGEFLESMDQRADRSINGNFSINL